MRLRALVAGVRGDRVAAVNVVATVGDVPAVDNVASGTAVPVVIGVA